LKKKTIKYKILINMTNLKISNYLHFEPVDKEIYIGWNRYYPSIFILNSYALELLDSIKKGNFHKTGEDVEFFLGELKKYKFIYEGKKDLSREFFLEMAQKQLNKVEQNAYNFYEQEEDYSELRIVNDVCNLNCSYCVNNYKSPRKTSNNPLKKVRQKVKMIDMCIDQFFARKEINNNTPISITFNGGEILMDWGFIKHIVERISRKYPGFNVQYQINTNLTLLNPEIASFFRKYGFKINISIDGYKEAHDKTRVFPGGKGSFDKIIEKLELFREITSNGSPKSFQGTIEYPDDFIPEEVYKMGRYGFIRARLAPNLLYSSVEDGKKKAKLMGKFLELNAENRFQVQELIFTRAKHKINQNRYYFDFNCRGLSGLPKLAIEFNITDMSVSHLCGFIHQSAVPFSELSCNIYNPKLWQVSKRFINERIETVLENCMECPLVGLCSGGCILSGIDSHNRLNEAACTYQREIWRIYLKKAYWDGKKKTLPEKKSKNRGGHQLNQLIWIIFSHLQFRFIS